MSPRGRERNEQLRTDAVEKITAAALRVFSEYGYHGATMKMIAEMTGLSYGLVYHYFPSKEAVFCSLVDFALESTISGMNTVLDIPGTAWEKLERYAAIISQTAFMGDSTLYFLIMIQALTQGKSIPGLMESIEKRSAGYYERLVPLVAQAQKSGQAAEGDPVTLVSAFLSFVQGLALLAFRGQGSGKKIGPELLLSVLRKGAA